MIHGDLLDESLRLRDSMSVPVQEQTGESARFVLPLYDYKRRRLEPEGESASPPPIAIAHIILKAKINHDLLHRRLGRPCCIRLGSDSM
jgi:hypothetical protein